MGKERKGGKDRKGTRQQSKEGNKGAHQRNIGVLRVRTIVRVIRNKSWGNRAIIKVKRKRLWG